MKGKVLGFNADKGVGHILSDDKRLPFVKEEWLSSEAPKSGQTVDFVVEGDDAKSIYLMHGEGRSEENTLHKSVDVIKRNPVERVRNLYIAHIVGLFIWPILLIALILSYVWKKDHQFGWHYKHQIRMVWTMVGSAVIGIPVTGLIMPRNGSILWILLMVFVVIYVVIGYVKGMRKLDGLTPEPEDKDTEGWNEVPRF